MCMRQTIDRVLMTHLLHSNQTNFGVIRWIYISTCPSPLSYGICNLGPKMTFKLSQEFPTPSLDITTEAFIIQNWSGFGCNSWYSFFLSVSRTSIVTQSRDRVFSYYYKLYIVLKERRTVCIASFYTALRNLSNCLTTQLGRELEGCVAESGTLQRRLHRAKTRHNENKNTYWEFHMSKETWIKPDEVFLSFRLWFLLVSLVLCPRWSGSTRLPPPFWHWTEVYKRITSLQININISDTRLIDGISSSSSSSLCATSFFVYVYTDDIRGCTRRMKWNKM